MAGVFDDLIGGADVAAAPAERVAYDGDTFTDTKTGERIRLKGADAPERKPAQAGATIATSVFQDLLDKGATVEKTGERTYDREVGRVTNEQGDVATQLIAKGVARPTLQYSNQEQRDAETRSFARRTLRGTAADATVTLEQAAIDAAVDADKATNPYQPDLSKQPGFSYRPNGVFEDSVQRGVDNAQASLYAAGNAIGEFTGVDTLAEWGEEGMYQNMLDAAQNPARVESYENIDSLAKLGTYVVEALGENLPNIAITATGAGTGATVAKAMLGKALLKRASLAGAGVPSYGLAVGETQQELKGAGIDKPGTALIAGIPIAGLDVVGLDLMLGRVFKEMSIKSAKDLVKQAAQGFGIGAAGEMPTEAAQELITMTARAMHDPEYDLFSEENRRRLIDAGLKGGLVGGVVGGASSTARAGFEFLRPEAGQTDSSRQGTTSDEGGDPTDQSAPTGSPTAVTPAPESQETIDAQAAAVRDETSAKDSLLVTPGSAEPSSTEGLGERIDTPAGTVYTASPDKAGAVKAAIAQPEQSGIPPEEILGETLFGIQGGKPQDGDRVVVAADKKGSPVAEIVASAQTEAAATEAAAAQAPAGGGVEVRSPEDVLADRQARFDAETETVSFTVETAAARIAIERAFPNAKVEGPTGGPWTVTEELPPSQVRGETVDSSAVRQALAKALDDGRRTQDKRLEFVDTSRTNKDGGHPKVRVNAQELIRLGQVVDDTPIGGDLTDIGHLRDKMLAAMSYLAELGLVPAGQRQARGRQVTGIPNSTVVYKTNTGAEITWGELMRSPRRDDSKTKDVDPTEFEQTATGKRKAFNPAPQPAKETKVPQGQKRTPEKQAYEQPSEPEDTRGLPTEDDQAHASARDRAPRPATKAQKRRASKAKAYVDNNVSVLGETLGRQMLDLVSGLMKHIGLNTRLRIADESGVVSLIEDLKAKRRELSDEYKKAPAEKKEAIAAQGAEINRQIAEYEAVLTESPAARILYNDFRTDPRNRVPLIFLSENVVGKRVQALHLAHELGHLVQRVALDTAPKEVQQALREALGTENFEENFANQLIRWVDRRAPARNIVDKFFKGLRDRLFDLWYYLRTTNGYRLNKTFGEFMDSLVVARTQREGGKPATVLGRRFVKHMENFVNGTYLPYRTDAPTSHDFTVPPGAQRMLSQAMSSRRGTRLLTVGKNLQKVFRAALDYGVRSNDAYLRAIGSPTATWLADQWHKRAGDVKRAATIPEEIRRFMGPFHEQLNGTVERLPKVKKLKVFGEVDVNSAEYQELYDLLINQTTEAEFAARGDRVGELGVEMRRFFDGIHDKMTGEYGVKVSKRAGYFPLIVDMNKWMHGKDRVITKLMDNGIGRTEAEQFHQYVVEVNGSTLDSMSVADEPLAPGFRFKKRHEYLNYLKDEFMVDDLHTAAAFYLHSAARRAVIEKRFRLDEAEARNPRVAAELKRLRVNANNPIAGLHYKLAKAFDRGELTSEQYKHIRNKILEGNLGRLGAGTNPLLKRFSSGIVLYQNIRLLGFAVLTSLVDPGQTLWRSDMNFRWNLRAFKDTVLDKQKREELYKMARLIGTIQDDVTDHVLNDQMNTQFLGPDVRKWNERFFRAILMHQWTNITRVAAMSVGRDYILDHARKAAQGEQDSVRRLQELGVSAEQVMAWDDAGQALEGHQEVYSAINTFVDEAIIRPDSSVRPWWGSDPRFMLIFHLKSFMWGYHEQILRRLWTETKNKPALMKAIPMLGLMAATLPLAMLGYETRRQISWWGNPPKHTNKDGWEYFQELGERAGYLGVFQLYVDADQAEEFGKFSVLSVLGPSFDQVGEFLSKDFDYFALRATPLLAQSSAARAWIREQ